MTIYAAIKYYNDLADDIDKNPLPGDSSVEPRQIADWLEELKIFQELYPDTDIKGSLRKNYEQGRKDAVARDYNTILIYEDTIRNMLLNANPENNLIEWVDLNGKLNAIAHIKHLIYDLEQ